MTGSLLNYNAGSRPLDPIVNIIDGKPIYEDNKGRTYAYDNLFGMRYDTTGADSLDAVQRDIPQSTDDDDEYYGSSDSNGRSFGRCMSRRLQV